MPIWKELYNKSLSTADEIASVFGLDTEKTKEVLGQYPALVNEYYKNLCVEAGDSLIRQVIPRPEELSPVNEFLPEDPIGEDNWSPVPNLTHRYKDRVLFLVSDRCPVYCRFCTRKRKVGRTLKVTFETIDKGFAYIEKHEEIRDVLLSGGDPLMLEDKDLAIMLERFDKINHVEILRIGTRVPAALPQRITYELVSTLSKRKPLYIHTHFNHPLEVTDESQKACQLLADAGIPLSNQTVLLRGINDDVDTLESLFRRLLAMRVRPYYLFQVDMVRGTEHFRSPLLAGVKLMEELRLRTSPMALPSFVVDLPEGAGKVFPSLTTIVNVGKEDQAICNLSGVQIPYPDPV